MRSSEPRPLGILYEHPAWFGSLFAELDRRGLPYAPIHAPEHSYDPRVRESPYGLVFNRMSPSAHTRGHGHTIRYTSHYLAHLESLGVPLLNGREAWRTEISKARQLDLFEELGVPYPPARVIHDPGQAPVAARGLRFPVVSKPNVGGSGAGIRRFDEPESLAQAVGSGTLDMGVDGTALVQEFIPPRDGRITRVEVMDDRILYAIGVRVAGEDFNLCPADICQDEADGPGEEVGVARACLADEAPVGGDGAGDRVVAVDVPSEVRDTVRRVVLAAGMQIGGVEYLTDERTGQRYYYDVNALSNFVADAPRIVGFDPIVDLVDWLESEWSRAAPSAEHAS
ncbi:MAG: ATP-grasp domain-containing protein [Gemmatimonadota bacterium]